jgi:CNT family concentrative nucleoside transporter
MELKLVSLLGLVAMVATAWALSEKRKLFPWRAVLWGVGLQFAFALLILDTDFGKRIFDLAGRAIQKLIQFSNEGCKFVFGPLADGDMLAKQFGAANNLIFAILVVGTIIIVASLSSLFYHWGILQKVVQAFAWVMRKAMCTSGSETLSAAANIFMGPDRGAAAHQALHPAHDAQRTALHDDRRHGDHCRWRRGGLCQTRH